MLVNAVRPPRCACRLDRMPLGILGRDRESPLAGFGKTSVAAFDLWKRFCADPFYKDFDSKLNGLSGTLIRQKPRTGAPLDALAYRVLYRSTGLKGEPIAVSGAIIIPAGQPPPGGCPIVAWAHPTTGIVPRCAPSLALFLFQQIQGLREMMRRGYIVAATDYPGLGTPHSSAKAKGVPFSIPFARRARSPAPEQATKPPSGVIRKADKRYFTGASLQRATRRSSTSLASPPPRPQPNSVSSCAPTLRRRAARTFWQ